MMIYSGVPPDASDPRMPVRLQLVVMLREHLETRSGLKVSSMPVTCFLTLPFEALTQKPLAFAAFEG